MRTFIIMLMQKSALLCVCLRSNYSAAMCGSPTYLGVKLGLGWVTAQPGWLWGGMGGWCCAWGVFTLQWGRHRVQPECQTDLAQPRPMVLHWELQLVAGGGALLCHRRLSQTCL